MPFTENPERGLQISRSQNEHTFPNVITSISPTFGAPKVPIYIYNVSPMGWETERDQIRRPPNFPHIFIRPCPAGQDCVLVNTLEHPFAQRDRDQNDNIVISYRDGFREATRLLSPQNPGTDQNWTLDDALNEGENLNDFGVFWSMNKPPKPEEIAAARTRMERTFRAELARMGQIESRDPQNAGASANKISRAAALYYKQTRSWFRYDLMQPTENSGKVACGACGESIQAVARICVHCGAPTDPEKLERWIEKKFREPGRPKSAESE